MVQTDNTNSHIQWSSRTFESICSNPRRLQEFSNTGHFNAQGVQHSSWSTIHYRLSATACFILLFLYGAAAHFGLTTRRKAATYTGQHKHRINANFDAFSGIRTHDPSVQTGESISCLRPRGQYDLGVYHIPLDKYYFEWYIFIKMM
jgi:hypothetical protein